MRRISDEYILRQAQSRPNIDASHRCVFRCPQCARQKTYTQNQIKRSFDIGVNELQKILDFYNRMNFCGQISDPIYHPQFLLFLKILILVGTNLLLKYYLIKTAMCLRKNSKKILKLCQLFF